MNTRLFPGSNIYERIKNVEFLKLKSSNINETIKMLRRSFCDSFDNIIYNMDQYALVSR